METTTCDHHQLQQKKKSSKGKQKIPITRIVDKNSRQVTFTKRRNGLFRKCSQLSSLFPNTQFAVITFSVGGNPFSTGYPSVDTVLNRFLEDTRQNSNSRNVTVNDNNWWETRIDDIKLEDLKRFQVALEGLKKGVDSWVEEIGRVNEPESIRITNDANFGNQISDYPDVIDCNDYECNYASPSPEFSDTCPEITESYEFGPVDGKVKSSNFGCNDVEWTDANLCPDKSQVETESFDFGSVNTSLGAQVSDFCPEIIDIDFGCDDVEGTDANLCPKSQGETESFDFGSVNTSLGAQVSDFCPEIRDIDFGCDDESFSLQFLDNSDERRMSFDLTEILKNVTDVECIDASRADDSYLLRALSCC